MKHFITFFTLGILVSGVVKSQETSSGVVSGNISMLFQSYEEDSLIGAVVPPSKSGLNAYSNIIYTQGNFSAGLRYESYLNSVLGFPGRFKGSGIGYRYARWSDKEVGVDVTVGNFYETFGRDIFSDPTKRETWDWTMRWMACASYFSPSMEYL